MEQGDGSQYFYLLIFCQSYATQKETNRTQAKEMRRPDGAISQGRELLGARAPSPSRRTCGRHGAAPGSRSHSSLATPRDQRGHTIQPEPAGSAAEAGAAPSSPVWGHVSRRHCCWDLVTTSRTHACGPCHHFGTSRTHACCFLVSLWLSPEPVQGKGSSRHVTCGAWLAQDTGSAEDGEARSSP